MTTSTATAHVCWSYDDRRELDAYARSYLASGLAQGEQVWYVPGHRPGEIGDWLLKQEGPAGAVRVVPLGDAYPAGQVIDPAGQVAAYRSATEQAIAGGFTGPPRVRRPDPAGAHPGPAGRVRPLRVRDRRLPARRADAGGLRLRPQ